jgi:phosphoribosylaminoimidazole (AIR) synthetase
VSIDAGEEAVARIRDAVRSTARREVLATSAASAACSRST